MRSRRATPRAPRQGPEERRTNLLSAAYAPETYFGVAHFCFWLLVIGAGCATFDSRPNIIFGVNSTLHELMDVVWKFCLWVGVAGLGLVLGAKLVNKLMGVRPASPKAIINSVHLPPSPLFNWVLAACIPVMVFAIVKTGAIERDSYIMEDSRGGGLFNVLSYVILLMPSLCGIAFVQNGRSLILCG
ncbi:MAG: hypothetical protein JWO82_4086, partial [Akkermansiaceae bacterium]|nr:hypothetical protein [Akkermansiaceae bacterium]